MIKYEGMNVTARSQIYEHFLHRARASQEEAVTVRKNMKRLIITDPNSRRVGLLFQDVQNNDILD